MLKLDRETILRWYFISYFIPSRGGFFPVIPVSVALFVYTPLALHYPYTSASD